MSVLVLATMLAAQADPGPQQGKLCHAGFAVGYLFWQSAYGEHDGRTSLRLAGGRRLTGWLPYGDWMVARMALETSWRSDETRDLQFQQTATFATAALGGTMSYRILRAEALLELGPVIETTNIRESGAKDRGDTAVSLSLGGYGGLGLTYKDTAVLIARAGVRTRASRLDLFTHIGIDWFF